MCSASSPREWRERDFPRKDLFVTTCGPNRVDQSSAQTAPPPPLPISVAHARATVARQSRRKHRAFILATLELLGPSRPGEARARAIRGTRATMASHALSTYSSRVFYLKTRRSEIAQTATGIPRRAIPTPPPRSLATARVASPRARRPRPPPAMATTRTPESSPSARTASSSRWTPRARTSSEDRARDAPGDDDDWALDSAVEVIRGPDGDVLFRFTGDAEEHYNAAVAFASEEDLRARRARARARAHPATARAGAPRRGTGSDRGGEAHQG